ncbi:putative vacuolar atp synthase subunit D [Jaminaea rosea]|uniref:V-type proton ATPase subunit n=1 Tax=Jaminaea rosea TaxID=1569628 RepID=A0A316UIZ2_9BASI|nr:putative vacuolar atp synthase subunit D [Jaminaea rosea]PWN25252.1 putative vacuolar atp synthase subunit D [Jaminaea rosea]
MEMLTFNATGGYLEGVVRGYRNSLLTSQTYSQLSQCETLEDLKMQLSATDYGNFLANEQPPITTSTIAEKATGKLVGEFQYLRDNATGPLREFLDYLTYAYMIDNLILLITGTLHERDTHELLDRCHPLGHFDGMEALCVATTVEELYNSVVVETPLAEYFKECLSASDLDDLNIEIIRNSLYKAYLEDFYNFTQRLGGTTAIAMGSLLSFEADRRTLNITLNSFGTSLTKEQRAKLFPSIGRLYPEGNNALARADDVDQVKQVCDMVPEYKAWWKEGGMGGGGGGGGEEGSEVEELEGKMFREETRLNRIETMCQFNYSPFYSWLKLKEQEIRSITWIAECIAQDARDRIGDFVHV